MTLKVIVLPDTPEPPDVRVAVRVVGPSAGGSLMMGLGLTDRVRVVLVVLPTMTFIVPDWSAMELSMK